MDWSSVGLLAGITLAEGIMRVPRGAMVLRRWPGGDWTLIEESTNSERDRIRLLRWWAPFSATLILPPVSASSDNGRAPFALAPLEERLRRAQRWRLALSLCGGATLLTLVFGVPAASGWFGGAGFLTSLALLGNLVVATTLLAGIALRHLGLGYSRRQVWREVRGLLSPFAAPQAADRLLRALVADDSPLVAARALLPEAAFTAWIRPRVYDARERPDPALTAVLGDADRDAVVAAEPPLELGGDRYCRRCGATYTAAVATCERCGIGLTARAAVAAGPD